jgi:outer membrane protein TolC
LNGGIEQISVPGFLVYPPKNMSLTRSLFSSFLIALSGSALSAQTVAEGKLTAKDLLAQAIENNLGLEVERLEVGIREDNVDAEWGRFSPIINFEIGVDKVFRARNSEELATDGFAAGIGPTFEGERSFMTTSLGGRIPLGTSYEFTVGATRNDNTFTNRASTPFDPEYGADVRLTVTQPLLKNFGIDVNLAPIRIAEVERAVAEHETEGAIEAVLARVLLATYEVYFAAENVSVKEESIELAKDLLEANRKRVEQGRMSPIDITQAEARLAEARAERVEAIAFFKERQARLRELTQTNYEFGGTEYQFDTLGDLLPLPGQMDRAQSYAASMLKENPDYLASLKQAEAEGIRVVFNRNQVYPEVNLRLSAGTSGLEDGFGRSFSDFENRDGLDWGAAIVVSMPLDNRTAKAQLRSAQKRKSQALLRVKETELQLLRSLDTAVDNVNSGMERRLLIRESVRLAEEALKAEEVRLVNGVTTNIDVLNQQRELSLSQTQALSAEVETHRAWLQLLLLQGTLAERLGFDMNFETGGAE